MVYIPQVVIGGKMIRKKRWNFSWSFHTGTVRCTWLAKIALMIYVRGNRDGNADRAHFLSDKELKFLRRKKTVKIFTVSNTKNECTEQSMYTIKKDYNVYNLRADNPKYTLLYFPVWWGYCWSKVMVKLCHNYLSFSQRLIKTALQKIYFRHHKYIYPPCGNIKWMLPCNGRLFRTLESKRL